jgi:hypothetical protein
MLRVAMLLLMVVFQKRRNGIDTLRRPSLLPSRKGPPMKRLHRPLATLLMLCLITAARAQKVVLYDGGQTNQFVGSAVWRSERAASAQGQKPDVVVRAEIEIPEQKIAMRLSLRRNDDKQFPASHAVEIVFTLPPDFPHGGISNIPGILMKEGETTRGIPLNGVAIKTATNFFRFGLSSVDVDMQRNVQLLKERSWFDIPVVYSDGKRAIIAIEKGISGERAFTEAFAMWGQ